MAFLHQRLASDVRDVTQFPKDHVLFDVVILSMPYCAVCFTRAQVQSTIVFECHIFVEYSQEISGVLVIYFDAMMFVGLS